MRLLRTRQLALPRFGGTYAQGPQNEARGLAVIAEAKRVIPNKPIRYVVNTHAHFDHASGLAPFAAEGVTIITHESNVAFLEKTLSALERWLGTPW